MASVGLRGEPTGQPLEWRGDVAAVAKRDLKAGETLDGEGGFTVWGRLLPAGESLRRGALPIGLAHHVQVTRPVRSGEVLSYDDVAIDQSAEFVAVRRQMEQAFGGWNRGGGSRVSPDRL